jgi:hypothetical protein
MDEFHQHSDQESGTSHPIQREQNTLVLRDRSPQILLSSDSQFPKTLDKLKIRKRVEFFPLRVTLKADYETKTRTFTYGCSVKVRWMTILRDGHII